MATDVGSTTFKAHVDAAYDDKGPNNGLNKITPGEYNKLKSEYDALGSDSVIEGQWSARALIFGHKPLLEALKAGGSYQDYIANVNAQQAALNREGQGEISSERVGSKSMAASAAVDALAKELQHNAKGQWILPATAIATMQKSALQLQSGQKLYDTVAALARFAEFLAHNKKSPQAGESIVLALKPLVEKLELLAVQDSRAVSKGAARASQEKKSLAKPTGTAGALGPQPKRGVGIKPKTKKTTR